jgi:hypothetical protein
MRTGRRTVFRVHINATTATLSQLGDFKLQQHNSTAKKKINLPPALTSPIFSPLESPLNCSDKICRPYAFYSCIRLVHPVESLTGFYENSYERYAKHTSCLQFTVTSNNKMAGTSTSKLETTVICGGFKSCKLRDLRESWILCDDNILQNVRRFGGNFWWYFRVCLEVNNYKSGDNKNVSGWNKKFPTSAGSVIVKQDNSF